MTLQKPKPSMPMHSMNAQEILSFRKQEFIYWATEEKDRVKNCLCSKHPAGIAYAQKQRVWYKVFEHYFNAIKEISPVDSLISAASSMTNSFLEKGQEKDKFPHEHEMIQ